ncbi:sporulation inhibitor of replication protein SirA [Sporosarcina aquimarina]|uniref:Sporulation inhibitor of replication protein SirA n=1 Tax=Sporosarcina aquimarina TaxID=114975 RepID=A0ABU4FYG1_9BACL|nr:sporulation inhibitor of replication protein SirA [Sporosarcina aquimarina]MDW0109142.1 sporulation inhibitor of replication protein SirA [Sporosarcina aquimarina]
MRTYGIYKIKETYQTFVLGRERLLYDLLKADGRDTHLQEVRYLCDRLEIESIESAIMNELGKNFHTVEAGDMKYTLTHPLKGTIDIGFSSHALHAACHGSRMLDLDLFVALSSAEDRYFAIMDEVGEWGWLKPVKYASTLVESQHVLV